MNLAALPVHQILKTSSTASGTDESTDGVVWRPIDKPGGWRGSGGGLKRAFTNRQLGDMKCEVNLHGSW